MFSRKRKNELSKAETKRMCGLQSVAFLLLAAVFLAAGCTGMGQNDKAPVRTLYVEEEIHLTDDVTSPACTFSMAYSYLNEKDDSLASLINRHVQQEVLGGSYASLAPEAAVDSFKNTCLRDYRNEVRDLYLKDLETATSEEDIPHWYNHEYRQESHFEEGREGIWNYTSDASIYTGGAHPYHSAQWMNFDRSTGQRLTLEDVFLPTARKDMETLLQTAFDKTGHPQLAAIYLPENFLLGKDRVSFLFNPYDIAPYSSGMIVLDFSYAEMEPYMNPLMNQ